MWREGLREYELHFGWIVRFLLRIESRRTHIGDTGKNILLVLLRVRWRRDWRVLTHF